LAVGKGRFRVAITTLVSNISLERVSGYLLRRIFSVCVDMLATIFIGITMHDPR